MYGSQRDEVHKILTKQEERLGVLNSELAQIRSKTDVFIKTHNFHAVIQTLEKEIMSKSEYLAMQVGLVNKRLDKVAEEILDQNAYAIK